MLTRPAAASSQLVVPGAIEGPPADPAPRRAARCSPSWTRRAAVAVRLAMASGPYTVLLRRGDEVRECDVTLPAQSTVSFDLATCRAARLRHGRRQGRRSDPPWGLELALGVMEGRRDGYVQEMRQFGFNELRRQRLARALAPAVADRRARARASPRADARPCSSWTRRTTPATAAATPPTPNSAGRPSAWAPACAARCPCCATA